MHVTMGTNYCTIEHPQWNIESVCLICNEWHHLPNNENISIPFGRTGISLVNFSIVYENDMYYHFTLGFQNNHPKTTKQIIKYLHLHALMYAKYNLTWVWSVFCIHTLFIDSTFSPFRVLDSLQHLTTHPIDSYRPVVHLPWVENPHFPHGS